MCRYGYYYYAECQHQETVLVDFCARAEAFIPPALATPTADAEAEISLTLPAAKTSGLPSLTVPLPRASTLPDGADVIGGHRPTHADAPPLQRTRDIPPHRPLSTAASSSSSCSTFLQPSRLYAPGCAEASISITSNQDTASNLASLPHHQQQTDLRHRHHILTTVSTAEMSEMAGLIFSRVPLRSLFQNHAQAAPPVTTSFDHSDISAACATLQSPDISGFTHESSELPENTDVLRHIADSRCNINIQHEGIGGDDYDFDFPRGRKELPAIPGVSAAVLLQKNHEMVQILESQVMEVNHSTSAPELSSPIDFPPLVTQKLRRAVVDEAQKSSMQTSPRFAQPTKAFSVRTNRTVHKEILPDQTAAKKSPKRTSLPLDWARELSRNTEQTPSVSPKTPHDAVKSTSPSYMSPTKATIQRNVAIATQEQVKRISPRPPTALPRVKTTLPQLKAAVRSPTTTTSTSSYCPSERIITDRPPELYTSQHVFSRSAPVRVTLSAEIPIVPNTKPVRRGSRGSIILPIQQKLDKWGLLNSCATNASPQAADLPRVSQELKSVLRAEAKVFVPYAEDQDGRVQDVEPSSQVLQAKPLSVSKTLGRSPVPTFPQTPPISNVRSNMSDSPLVGYLHGASGVPVASPSTWSFTSSSGSNNDHWSGGDGREIRFTGNGARAERYLTHTPFPCPTQHSSLRRSTADASSPRSIGSWAYCPSDNQQPGLRPASPPLAPRSRKQWAQMLGSSRIPCSRMEFMQASEQGLYQALTRNEPKYWGHCGQCATSSH